jgi:hypothetical protein
MEATAMTMETAIKRQQQDFAPPADSVATVFVKGGDDSTSTKQTITLLNSLPGIVDAESSADQPDLITVRFDPQQTRVIQIVQSVRKVEYQSACIALLYFNDNTDSDYKRNAAQSVITQPGVIAAERSAHKAYVLLVHFDQNHTRGSHIVNALREQGYSAMRVGC